MLYAATRWHHKSDIYIECLENNQFSTNTKFYLSYNFQTLEEFLRNLRKSQYLELSIIEYFCHVLISH